MTFKHITNFCLFLLAAVVCLSFSATGVVQAQENQFILNSKVESLVSDPGAIVGETLIIKYNQNQTEQEVKNDFKTQIKQFDSKDSNSVSLVKEDTALVSFSSPTDLKSGLKSALANSEVEYAQPLYKYSLFADYAPTQNTNYSGQWYLQNIPSGVNIAGAFGKMGDYYGVNCPSDARCGGTSTTKVAVIDSGVKLDGTELNTGSVDTTNALRFFYNNDNTCAANEYFETLNLGTIASPNLVNFCRRVGGELKDDVGHGTTVGSIINMENNTTYGVGTAYNTKLLPIALDGDYAYNSFIVSEAINYAVNQGAGVINLSMGTSVDDPFLKQAVLNAYNQGVVVVVSSGNCANKTALTCGIGGNNTVSNPKIYPAEYSEVLSIGAVNYGSSLGTIKRSSYSSYGNDSNSLDFVVGVGDGSGSPYGVHGINNSGTYVQTNTGTSFSAPVVSGIVALAKSIRPDMNLGLIKQLLINSSKDLTAAENGVNTTGFDKYTGYGIIDAGSFITSVINPTYASKYDFDGNGSQDVLFQSIYSPVVTWNLDRNDTLERFTEVFDPRDQNWVAKSVADVDGNGFTDILLQNKVTGHVALWFLKNNFYMSGVDYSFVASPGQFYKVVTLTDMNNDGIPDIVFQNTQTGEVVSWYLNKQGGVTNMVSIINPSNFNLVVKDIADIDGNGYADLLVQDNATNQILVWTRSSAGYTGQVNYFQYGWYPSDWRVVGLAYMNGDTVPDIVQRNIYNGTITFWTLNSAGQVTGGQAVYVLNDSTWNYITHVDYDKNGYEDILLRNSVTGKPHIWQLGPGGYYNSLGFGPIGNPGTVWNIVPKFTPMR